MWNKPSAYTEVLLLKSSGIACTKSIIVVFVYNVSAQLLGTRDQINMYSVGSGIAVLVHLSTCPNHKLCLQVAVFLVLKAV